MPTRLDTNYPALTNSDEFELMIRDICALEWNDPHTEKFGRKGQKQFGVDVYGQPVDLNGQYRAAQCKLRTKKDQLTEEEIESEVAEAKQFPHALDTLILVTDAPRDTHTQILVDRINKRELEWGNFRVVIWFWDNITERLAAHPKLIVKYYPHFYASLTTLPVIERLIDTPLQIVSINQAQANTLVSLEELLRLRGLRIVEPGKFGYEAGNLFLSDISPDGAMCSCGLFNTRPADKTLLKFASDVKRCIQMVENSCPIFVVLPSSLITLFLKAFTALDSDPQRIQILPTEMPMNELAESILQDVFRYGYARRGGPATIDIAIRSREGRPDAVLLDLDWHERVSTSHFPTNTEWKDVFVPTLTNVRSQLLNQSDRARIQISCQLPLPAAFALGFFFNVRLARIGVWARKTEVSDFKKQFWLSDGEPADVTFIPKWLKSPDDGSVSAIIELTSYVTIHQAVSHFIKASGLIPDAWLQIRLEKEGKALANIEEGDAIAYANQIGQAIRHLNEQGITDIHLFARIPPPLAVLIGQRLHACGRIYLYWFDNPTYRSAFTLL